MTSPTKMMILALVALSALVGAASAGAAPAQEYVPFVTDFPQAGGTGEYVPFVTDFGLEPRRQGEPVVIGPIRSPEPVASGSRDWGTLALGWSFGFGFAVLLAAGVLGIRRLSPATR